MKRLVAGAIAISVSLAILALGGWLIGRGNRLGIAVLILGILGFVVSAATTLPQSTDHARDE